ncbi:MAG: hypothetical protein NTZ09_07045 [Candidatus Hydrogenedentes bacterium]|nr:hypothetical protein [Candidatus Hydrogenedentota bacterium]
MKRIGQVVFILTLLFSLTAQAVPPAYRGPLGNPEEPTMHPYKWLFRGVPSLPPKGSLTERGYINTFLEDDPFLGYAADFLAGGYFYGVGENGLLGLDFVGNVLGAAKYGRDAVNFSAGIIAAQGVVDLLPMYDTVDRELVESRAADIQFDRRVNRTVREPLETDRDRAQRLYIGERAMINRRNTAPGNISRYRR